MDIIDTSYKDHSEDGVEFVVLDPVSKETFTGEDGVAFALKLRAFGSRPVLAADKEFRRIHPAKNWSEDEQKAYRLAVVKAALVGWVGTRLEFSPENAPKILGLWDGKLVEKAYLFILDGDRFLRA